MIKLPNNQLKHIKSYLIILFISVLLFSCGNSKRQPLNESQLKYAGTWIAPGNISFTISADGGGNFEFSNSKVTGGNVMFNDSGFKIGLFGIEKHFIIDQEPYDENGDLKMIINGIKFKKIKF